MRELTYLEALNEAFHQILEVDRNVFIIGGGITSPWYVGGTTKGLLKKFGKDRIIDAPTSENGVTGFATGSALTGLHPIVCYPRHDFMYLAMDQICNMLANWRYMNGGNYSLPVTLWAIINRGCEQAAQHSQALHSVFSHIPGLKVVAPSNAYDVKGLLATAVLKEKNPVVFVDDRWLYDLKCEVPQHIYYSAFGQAHTILTGKDLTVVSSSWLTSESLKAVKVLSEGNVSAELIDLVTLKPMDVTTILRSVKTTGRLVVVDGGWKSFGYSAEVVARVAEQMPVKTLRIALPNTPAPACSELEKGYYVNAEKIVEQIQGWLIGYNRMEG